MRARAKRVTLSPPLPGSPPPGRSSVCRAGPGIQAASSQWPGWEGGSIHTAAPCHGPLHRPVNEPRLIPGHGILTRPLALLVVNPSALSQLLLCGSCMRADEGLPRTTLSSVAVYC